MAPSTSSSSDQLASGVAKLSLGTKGTKAKKAAPVADSWEDEDISSDSEPEATPTAITDDDLTNSNSRSSSPDRETTLPSTTTTKHKKGTTAPPPTPMNPTYTGRLTPPPPPSSSAAYIPSENNSNSTSGTSSPAVEPKRPEKTDAVARRMIASALGMKVPRLTEEQRAYDRAVREKERKRREEEKALAKVREAEAAKAKASVWED
ncbi:hypothetical protein B0T19DRAFT_443603 [Cercophora scortea]|uniref:Uncharacterized protein n=1 Tax=Cercophora scortea TaxID=314031 RepID=A0AAE0M9R7_9PEZI|nr:hypothetical protein B0T19DRAFT_443603 [Cercophora scortea]